MKIKEVEEIVGIDRETIRFYIREGLLSPVQLENRHREYTDEDIRQLKRIKVLRQLGMSIPCARGVFSGDIDFNSALAESKRRLEQHRSAVERSILACDALMDKDPRGFDPSPYYADDA